MWAATSAVAGLFQLPPPGSDERRYLDSCAGDLYRPYAEDARRKIENVFGRPQLPRGAFSLPLQPSFAVAGLAPGPAPRGGLNRSAPAPELEPQPQWVPVYDDGGSDADWDSDWGSDDDEDMEQSLPAHDDDRRRFMDALGKLDPQLPSRGKATALGHEFEMSREDAAALAEHYGVSLGVAERSTKKTVSDMDDVCARLGPRSAQGATMRSLAAENGMGSKTLQRRMRAAGVATRHECGAVSDGELETLIRMLQRDMGFKNTGVTYTLSESPAPPTHPPPHVFDRFSWVYITIFFSCVPNFRQVASVRALSATACCAHAEAARPHGCGGAHERSPASALLLGACFFAHLMKSHLMNANLLNNCICMSRRCGRSCLCGTATGTRSCFKNTASM